MKLILKRLTTGGILLFLVGMLSSAFITTSVYACSKSDTNCTYQVELDPAAGNASCKAAASGNCEKIYSYVDEAINLLSAVVGIIVVAVIVFSGIQFSTSGGDPQKVASAKTHITNAVIALVAFLLLWAFLNFIIPGGIFNGKPS